MSNKLEATSKRVVIECELPGYELSLAFAVGMKPVVSLWNKVDPKLVEHDQADNIAIAPLPYDVLILVCNTVNSMQQVLYPLLQAMELPRDPLSNPAPEEKTDG